jgi:Holliday junction resolvase RusA-like endonuclease
MVSNAPKRLGIALYVVFYMPIPKSWSKKKNLELNGKPVLVKPDSTNLLKMIEDRMNEIIYDDDKRIYDVRGVKLYSDTPSVDISLTYEVG